jgi:hypothetical protein
MLSWGCKPVTKHHTLEGESRQSQSMKVYIRSCAQRYALVIPAVRRLRQENHEFDANLGYTETLSQKKKS